jgi:hypothetical protein
VSDIDTAVVDGLKVLDPNGRLEKLPRQQVHGEAVFDLGCVKRKKLRSDENGFSPIERY